MCRNLDGVVVKVVLVKVCVSQVDCLQFGKPFSFTNLPFSAGVGLVPQQSQVDEAGAVVTQGSDLNSLHLGEVDAHQTGAVSATEQDELFYPPFRASKHAQNSEI